MKITVSVDNNAKIMVMPFAPVDGVEISYGSSSNENKESEKYGTIKVLGPEPLAGVNMEMMFPNGRQPFMEPQAKTNPMEYVRFFRDNRKKRKPFRVIVTRKDGGEVFNRLMALESFSINKVTKTGDFFCTLQFEQYRMVR